MGKAETAHKPVNPWHTLHRVSWWLGGCGAVLVVAGSVAMYRSFSSGQKWSILWGIGAFIGWLVPGAIYLICAFSIPRRQRWAITAADLATYMQMFFAGVLVVMSLLQIKAMWPMLILGLSWVVPLAVTPWLTAPCSRAM